MTPGVYAHDLIVWWSDEDQAFIADVPEMPGFTSKGKTRAQAIEGVERAIALASKDLQGTRPGISASRRRRGCAASN
jgi:predicted RNase H-like HicB family nuclease